MAHECRHPERHHNTEPNDCGCAPEPGSRVRAKAEHAELFSPRHPASLWKKQRPVVDAKSDAAPAEHNSEPCAAGLKHSTERSPLFGGQAKVIKSKTKCPATKWKHKERERDKWVATQPEERELLPARCREQIYARVCRVFLSPRQPAIAHLHYGHARPQGETCRTEQDLALAEEQY